jgi:NAD(P)H-dependent FMN reductase/ketosteroid isomerase-like protein
MTAPKNVALLVGSLRAASLSRKIAQYLIEHSRPHLACTLAEIGDLPLYNEDREPSPPAAWSRFRAQVAAADAVLFVTPEYNRSIPGGLKNALDVGSRPAGKSVFNGKPAAVLSQSPSRVGGFGANHALRQSLVFLNMPAMQQPEAYIAESLQILDDSGGIKAAEVARLLDSFIESFAAWITRVSRATASTDLSAFLQQRRQLALDYVNGDGEPLRQILARQDPVTFFPPTGGAQTGAEAVTQRYMSDARHFSGPGESRMELLQSDAGQLAFWAGIQSARVRLAGRQQPVDMRLRVTEVFRIEAGEWRLIHRHADMLSQDK